MFSERCSAGIMVALKSTFAAKAHSRDDQTPRYTIRALIVLLIRC